MQFPRMCSFSAWRGTAVQARFREMTRASHPNAAHLRRSHVWMASDSYGRADQVFGQWAIDKGLLRGLIRTSPECLRSGVGGMRLGPLGASWPEEPIAGPKSRVSLSLISNSIVSSSIPPTFKRWRRNEQFDASHGCL